MLNAEIFLALNKIYETLLQGYRDDVEKYTQGRQMPDVVRFLLKEGWNMAGQTVTLGRFAGSNYNAREIGEAFRLLEKPCLPNSFTHDLNGSSRHS